MTLGVVGPTDRLKILEAVSKQPEVWTGLVDPLATEVREKLASLRHEPPWKQGMEIALHVRQRLSLAATSRFEPEALLAEWKIPVSEVRLESRTVDALSVWGARCGPAIIVNRSGHHGRLNGRRATVCHEIGHLLMDRDAGLPVGEVLGGRVPQEIEQRASSFAAELLIPREFAYQRVIECQDADTELGLLSAWFGVSREILAWQVRNGAPSGLPNALRAVLIGYVSEPQKF